MKISLPLILICSMVLSGCVLPGQTILSDESVGEFEILPTDSGSLPTSTTEPFHTSEPTTEPTLTSIPTIPTALNIGPGPELIPSGFNPLTGLLVDDPEMLKLPAVLISITNFPPSARPQSGLSFAAWVYELYIAEGMTRFLTVFYGNYPQFSSSNSLGSANGTAMSGEGTPSPTATTIQTTVEPPVLRPLIGPIRSGRLPYAAIRDFYRSSCLVYAGATIQIRNKLKGCALVFGTDSGDINSAMLDVTKLQSLAKTNNNPNSPFNYSGNYFSEEVPSAGAPATELQVLYSFLNQSQWKFDPATGNFLKFEDFADGSGNFRPMTDRLNGQQLSFSNVIVLYTEHTVLEPYIIDVALGSGERGKAVIFRDGQKFEAVWTTLNGDYEKKTGMRRPLRFEDAAGNPFPLKPGQSWVHIFTPYSYIEDKADGVWQLGFVAPAGSK